MGGTSPYDNEPVKLKGVDCLNINNYQKWTKKHKRDTRKFIEIQLDQYEAKANGWIFWCYKTENTIEWDFKRLARFELFPQPLTDRQYIKNGTDTKPDESEGAKKLASVLICLLSAILIVTFI